MENESAPLFLISFVPTFIACCVLLFRAFQHVRYRPQWLQNFIHESREGYESFSNAKTNRDRSPLLIAFLVLSLIGLITQVIATNFPIQNLTTLPRALAWVC